MTGPPPPLRAVLGVGSELELRATLQRVVDAAAELTGARYATLTTTGPGREDRTGVHTAGPSRAPHVPQGPGTWELPIDVDGEPFGRLHLAEKEGGGREFTAEDVRLLHVLAARAGLAIGNARRYEAARRRERWIEGAAAVTTALLTGGSAADALLTVAERARHLADAAAGVVLQRTEDGGMEIVVAATDETPADPDARVGIADPGDAGDIVGATIRPGSPVLVQLLGGEPVFIDDSATDPRMTTHVRHRFGPSMMLPLQADGQLIGTLALPAGAATSRTRRSRSCWPSSSPRRPPSPWSSPTPGTAASVSPSSRTATASPVTCTTWSSNGFSPPG